MRVLIDHMNFMYISFHMARTELKAKGIDEFTQENVGLFYHTLFNKYNFLFKTYGSLIICHEGKGSLDWRRSIYPEYKRNRDASKKEPAYEILKGTFNVVEDILKYYPCKQIKVDGAEADDCIFSLSQFFASQGEEVLVITTDGDLTQVVIDYPDLIQVYNPVRKQYVLPKKDIVKYKAIVGDPSDNIPGIYRIGEKKFEQMMNDKEIFKKYMKGDNIETYNKFLKIVDLKQFPKMFRDKAIEEYMIVDFNSFDPGNIEFFYYENAMEDHLRRWGNDISDINEALIGLNIKTIVVNNEQIKTKQVKIENNSEDDELDDILADFI